MENHTQSVDQTGVTPTIENGEGNAAVVQLCQECIESVEDLDIDGPGPLGNLLGQLVQHEDSRVRLSARQELTAYLEKLKLEFSSIKEARELPVEVTYVVMGIHGLINDVLQNNTFAPEEKELVELLTELCNACIAAARPIGIPENLAPNRPHGSLWEQLFECETEIRKFRRTYDQWPNSTLDEHGHGRFTNLLGRACTALGPAIERLRHMQPN